MKKVSSRKHDRFGRVLDSDPVYLIAALALMALLVSFYAVLLVNMNAIDTKTEDLKEHPYAVTVAAGRAETLLMQVRTLDNRLAFARTPETVASVKTEFASIDENLRTAFRVVEQRHHGNPEKVKDLVSNYEEFSELQDRLIALSAEDDSILDAALRQGADLPFACKGGVCATCKCKVLRGKVDMATNYSLEPDELAAGYVLSCQSLPLTADVIVDFDAKGMA